MFKILYSLLFLTGIHFCASNMAQAQTLKENIESYIPGFDYDFSLRYRYEFVEQNNALENANASTLRSRLNLRARPLEKLSVVLEFDNVLALMGNEYDSFAMNEYRGTHSVVADPVGTDINQALLNFSLTPEQNLVVGRQRILHANQRFVGGVGWRQNEQTFDALSYKFNKPQFIVDYSYVWDVKRIFNGRDTSAQAKSFDSNSHILLASFKQDWGNINTYLYALDLENAAVLSSRTYGISYSGKLGLFAVNAALARQSDFADNPNDYSASYMQLDASTDLGPINLLLGYEVLGSDNGVAAFTTPLATLHAFQGWADIFLNTPALGIKDAYIRVSGQAAAFSLVASYHDYSADEGSTDFGNEWNIQATYPFNPRINAAAKYARYSSENFAVDTDKFWLTLSVSF